METLEKKYIKETLKGESKRDVIFCRLYKND